LFFTTHSLLQQTLAGICYGLLGGEVGLLGFAWSFTKKDHAKLKVNDSRPPASPCCTTIGTKLAIEPARSRRSGAANRQDYDWFTRTQTQNMPGNPARSKIFRFPHIATA
jgi:hypothetical protein